MCHSAEWTKPRDFQVSSTTDFTLNNVQPTVSYRVSFHLIDLLHRAGLGISGGRNRLGGSGRRLLIDVVKRQPELDHAVDAGREHVGLVKREPRGEERGIEEQVDEILDGLVGLVGLDAADELLHDGVIRVDFHGLARRHVHGQRRVTERLRLHDALHVGGPAVFAGDKDAGGVGEAIGDDDLLHLVAEDLLDNGAEVLARLLPFLAHLLLILGLVKLDALLGGADELLAVVLLELLHAVLVDRLGHEENLEVLLLQLLKEGGVLHGLLTLARDVVDALLGLLHAGDILLEGDGLIRRLGGLVPEKVRKLVAVCGVLVNAELEVLGELLVERLVVLLVLGKLGEHVHAALDDGLADDLEDLVLLEHLAGNVEGQVLGIDDTLDEAKPLGDDLLAVIHNEHLLHVQLDVVELLPGLEEVERCAARGVEHGGKLEVALRGEVLHGQVILPVVGEALVEGFVLLRGDIRGLPGPDRLLLVEEGPLGDGLLNGLLLLLLLILLLDVLDLGLVGDLLNLGLRGLILHFLVRVLLDLLLNLLLGPEHDGVLDKLGVLFDKLLDLALLGHLELVLLEVENDGGSALEGLAEGAVVLRDGEGAAGGGLPDEGLVVVVLGADDNLVGDEVGGVEADAELANH
mmetsp:Transcript_10905/g.28681  ORF Transcript_10905/g.28681 Transcript_10905/m.28681 type:complete len:633 (+) Transcript_10905:1264-3162(+)